MSTHSVSSSESSVSSDSKAEVCHSVNDFKTKTPIIGVHYIPSDLEKLNETLTLDYMIDHSPYDVLPIHYYPDKELQHRPPVFVYGIPFKAREFMDYGRKHGLITGNSVLKRLELDELMSATKDRLDRIYDLPEGTITFESVIGASSGHCDIILSFMTSYKSKLPRERAKKFRGQIEDEFGIKAKWYLPAFGHNEYEDNYMFL